MLLLKKIIVAFKVKSKSKFRIIFLKICEIVKGVLGIGQPTNPFIQNNSGIRFE